MTTKHLPYNLYKRDMARPFLERDLWMFHEDSKLPHNSLSSLCAMASFVHAS